MTPFFTITTKPMAITPGTEPVLEAASDWADHCLVNDGSIFEPATPLWTAEHVSELVEHFVQNPKLDGRDFHTKLEDQLRPTSPGARKLAAEMMWVLMLFPSNISQETKSAKIRRVWELSTDPFPASPYDPQAVRVAIGSTGPGFINHQPDELALLVRFVQDLKSLPNTERQDLLDDQWRLVSRLDAYEGIGYRQLRHMLPHLLHPQSFERIASGAQKREILGKFGHAESLASGNLVDVDRALLQLREQLHSEYPDREHLDFYRPPLIERWQLDDAPTIELTDEAMRRVRDAFLRRFPDFSSFASPGGRLVEGELGYKEVLRDRFLAWRERLPPAGEVEERQAAEAVAGLKSLLTRKLDPYDFPQNLISWRYTGFIADLEPPEMVVLVRALVELTGGEVPSPARVQQFNADIWPILEAHESDSYAVSRSLPTLFLWLSDPEHEIYVRTDLFNGLARELTGAKLFKNKRMNMAEYQAALAFAGAIREELRRWGWEPRNMIDVQTFMWQAHEALRDQGVGNEDPPGPNGEPDQALDEVLGSLEADGFHFPPDLVANYILALQTKRFAILTGISGTGKTKLAIKVAEFFSGSHQSTLADHTQVIAVRPDWTDPRGLIGYHNPLSDQYLMTDLLRLLLAARDEEANANKEDRPALPYFVVLDEMNLARVEHYFSDFLSALESGRPLSLHHSDEDLKSSSGGRVPRHLRIPRNVFFTGTVNVDETTYMFSPKVLDRAFTIELNGVDLDGWALGEAERPGEVPGIDLPTLESPIRWVGQPGADEWRGFGSLGDGRLREVVNGLNHALAMTSYQFGYRVAAEIASFVLLAKRQGASDAALWTALDLALLEKVLPKFHGTEQEMELPLLIVHFVARHGRAPTEAEFDAGLESLAAPVAEAPARLSRCAAKVERMLRRLRHRGYAAFLE